MGKKLYPTINELTEWGSKYIDNCKRVELKYLEPNRSDYTTK
ncbi:hypothetical protein AB3Z07_14405 [Metabacillus halosaccharovorans]